MQLDLPNLTTIILKYKTHKQILYNIAIFDVFKPIITLNNLQQSNQNNNNSTIMFGGKLCCQGIVLDQLHNHILLAFSNTFYLFSLTNGTLLNKFTLHHHPILNYQSQPDQSIISVDQQGNICSFTIVNNNPQIKQKIHIKTTNTIKQIYIHNHNVYFIDQMNQFSCYNPSLNKINYLGVYSRLLGIWGSFIVLLTKQAGKNIVILSLQTQNIVLKHVHQNPIICCVIKGQSLIVGDQKGKIIILEGATSGNIKHQIMLEWHTHAVLTLEQSGNFLFSAGQESTIVMWHLKQHTKDFLPRIGTIIHRIYIQDNIIICFMSDNTVKSIDLNQDKKTLSYRIIIDPEGFQTINSQQTQYTTRKFEHISSNSVSETICLNGLPGKLQLISSRSANISDIQIVTRNYISRLDDGYPDPYTIKSFAFNDQWTSMLATVEGRNHSSLRFYNLSNGNWKISGKIQRPHIGPTEQCFALSDSLEDKFVSFSTQDPQIKIWKMYSQRKKSILALDQHYWNCEFEVSYRGRLPLWVSCANNIILVTYDSQIVFFDIKARKILSTYVIPNINKCWIVNQQYLRVCAELNDRLVVMKLKNKKNIVEYQFEYPFVDKIRVLIEKEHIVIQQCKLNCQTILLYNVNVKALANVWELDQNISGCFWFCKRLLIISNNMLFYDLTHNQQLFKTIQSNERKIQIQEEEETQIKQTNLSLQDLQERWITNQDINNMKKIQQIFINAFTYPSMITTFQTLVYQSQI